MAHEAQWSWTLLGILVLAGCCGRPRCAPCGALVPPSAPALPEVAATAPSAEPHRLLLEMSVLHLPASQAERVLGPARGRTARSMEILPAPDAAALWEVLSREPATVVLHMPSVLTRSGEEASIFVGESTRDDLHRPADLDPHTAALRDGAWWGTDVRVKGEVLPSGSAVSLDLAFILREAPAQGSAPDAAAFLAGQRHGRMGVARMASGDSVAIVLAEGPVGDLGDRVLFLAKATVLPPERVAAAR